MWVTGMALAHMHACRESFLRQLLTTQRSEKERVTNQIKEFQNGSKIKKKKKKTITGDCICCTVTPRLPK